MKTLNLKPKYHSGIPVLAGIDPSQNGTPQDNNSTTSDMNDQEPQENPSAAPKKGECPILGVQYIVS